MSLKGQCRVENSYQLTLHYTTVHNVDDCIAGHPLGTRYCIFVVIQCTLVIREHNLYTQLAGLYFK